MQKAIALCMTALLLLAGCLGTEDAEEAVDDVLEIVGCGDETSVTYNANATNVSDDLCVYEDVLENTIVDFINLMENGPDMADISSPVGYSVELSEVYADMEACMEWEYWNPDLVDSSRPYNGCPEDVEEVAIHYLETVVMTPTGYKSTMEHTIGEDTEMAEIIMEDNEMQYFFRNSTEDFTIRMKHAGTFEDALEGMMSDEDPLADIFGEGMGSEEEDIGGGVEGMVCYDQETSTMYFFYSEADCDEDGYFWVPEEYSSEELAEFGEFNVGNFTMYYEPDYALITGFAPDETGYTFSGINKLDFTPFSYFEIHTDSDFNVLGFTLEDPNKEDSWVEFMMISSGETSTDETITLSALPYVLVDLSEFSDDDGGDSDDIDWMVYDGGYCEWEGNPDDDERWSCKEDQSDSDWENWWYYCELHDGDWYCTDDFGQSSDYSNSADNDRYFNGYDEDSDDGYVEEILHYYDNCEGDIGDFECWMDEWDHDGDGDYEQSNGYDDCSELQNGTWECFVGYAEDGDEEESYFYDHCVVSDDGLSSLDCWTNEMDVDDDGNPEDNDSYWNYECEQLTDGTWECMTDHINYYDNCEDDEHESDLECWLDEWDTDNDGSYDLGSDGYMDYECEQLEDGRWACGHTDVIEAFQNYDNCVEENGMYDCWNDDWVDSEGNVSITDDYELEDCSELENGTWDCFIGYVFDNDEDEETYYCTPFVEYNSAGFSIYDNSSLDESLCGTEVMGDTYEFDDSAFTMPIHLTWEDCWLEDNETVCEQGEIYYDVNTTMLWETTHENNYMDCDGDYDNNTSMCTEWIGNITDSDGNAFLLEHDYGEMLMMYQYDEATQSGMVISVESDDDEMDPEMMFDMFDANDDGEVTASEWAEIGNQSEDGEMSEEDFNNLSMMIEMFDEDNSSGLNFDEFVNMMESMEGMGDVDEGEMVMLMAFSVFTFLEADVNDYTIELAMCSDALTADMECGDSVYSVPLSSIMASSEEEAGIMMLTSSVIFFDSDGSGTLTTGDYLMINNATLDVDGEWNFARLHSAEADSYSDENPMMSMLPGFTGVIATIGLLGAALIRRE